MVDAPSADSIAANVHEATNAAYSEGISSGVQIAESAIDEANRRVESAEEMATRIAAAALEGERGRRIEALEERVSNCVAVLENLQASVASLADQITSLSSSQAAIVGMELQEAVQSSSTPQALETLAETPLMEAAEIAEVLPETLQNVVAENPAPETPPQRKARRLM